MNPKYQRIGALDDKVIEECAEVIQAITKIKRFGLFNYHPDRPESNNWIEVIAEINDLQDALFKYQEWLSLQVK